MEIRRLRKKETFSSRWESSSSSSAMLREKEGKKASVDYSFVHPTYLWRPLLFSPSSSSSTIDPIGDEQIPCPTRRKTDDDRTTCTTHLLNTRRWLRMLFNLPVRLRCRWIRSMSWRCSSRWHGSRRSPSQWHVQAVCCSRYAREQNVEVSGERSTYARRTSFERSRWHASRIGGTRTNGSREILVVSFVIRSQTDYLCRNNQQYVNKSIETFQRTHGDEHRC